jgi:hypothetical protein
MLLAGRPFTSKPADVTVNVLPSRDTVSEPVCTTCPPFVDHRIFKGRTRHGVRLRTMNEHKYPCERIPGGVESNHCGFPILPFAFNVYSEGLRRPSEIKF